MADLRSRLLSLKAQNAQLEIEAQEKAKEAQQLEKEFKFTKEDFDTVKERGPAALRETELNRFKDKERELKQQNERLQQLLKDTLSKAPAAKASHSHAAAKALSKPSASSATSSTSKSADRPLSAVRARPATAATGTAHSAAARHGSPTKAEVARAGSPSSASATESLADARLRKQLQELQAEEAALQLRLASGAAGSRAHGTPTLAPSSADTMLKKEMHYELQSKDREIAYNEKRSDDSQRALDKAREKLRAANDAAAQLMTRLRDCAKEQNKLVALRDIALIRDDLEIDKAAQLAERQRLKQFTSTDDAKKKGDSVKQSLEKLREKAELLQGMREKQAAEMDDMREAIEQMKKTEQDLNAEVERRRTDLSQLQGKMAGIVGAVKHGVLSSDAASGVDLQRVELAVGGGMKHKAASSSSLSATAERAKQWEKDILARVRSHAVATLGSVQAACDASGISLDKFRALCFAAAGSMRDDADMIEALFNRFAGAGSGGMTPEQWAAAMTLDDTAVLCGPGTMEGKLREELKILIQEKNSMRAELGDLHKQLKRLEERHVSEGGVTSASNVEEEQRSMRSGYKSTLDDLRGAIMDLEREHEKLHVQYRRRLLDQANGLVTEGDDSTGLNAVTVSFYDLRWVTPAPASTLIVLCDFYMHPTQSGNVDASAWSKQDGTSLPSSIAKTFFDRTYKVRVGPELFAHLKTHSISVEFCSIQDGGASAPLGKAQIPLESLLLSHTGLCKEDAVSIIGGDGAVRAVFSCGVRFRTSIYSEARRFLRSEAGQSIVAVPKEPAAVRQRRILVSFSSVSDLKTSASRVYVMCDIPGSMMPVSSQVVAVSSGSAPVDLRKELPIAWSSDTATAFSQALEVILFDDNAVEGDGILASAFLPIAALAVDVALNGTYDLVTASKQKVGRLHATIQWA